MQKASGVDVVPGADENQKKMTLELRRVLILTLVGGTPKSNPSLDRVRETVYLSDVKEWLEDILTGNVGTFESRSYCKASRLEAEVLKFLPSLSLGGVDMCFIF